MGINGLLTQTCPSVETIPFSINVLLIYHVSRMYQSKGRQYIGNASKKKKKKKNGYVQTSEVILCTSSTYSTGNKRS